jgi:hypothetical protein
MSWGNRAGKVGVRYFLMLMAGWASVAILYSNLPAFLRPWLAAIFGVASLVALVGKYSTLRVRLGSWQDLQLCLSTGCLCRRAIKFPMDFT